MMKRPIRRLAALALAAALPVLSANAQLEGVLGKGNQTDALKGLAGMTDMPMTSGSVGNVAGLLQYCITNNYLGGDDPAAIKDKLLGKLPGGGQSRDPGYSDGMKGLLHGSNGESMDLGSGALKAQIAKRVCDAVLSQAKTFL
jgi:hypothetical protein